MKILRKFDCFINKKANYLAILIFFLGISTGQIHAAHLTNDETMEEFCRHAGKISGELSFPLVYAPEFHFQEFKSAVADMKNSVAVRI